MARILFVDPHTLFRRAVINLIQDFGLDVHGAENGKDGLSKLSEATFDLVITELIMPTMDGVEFIQKAKRSYPDLKFIVLTSHDSVKYVKHMIENGVQSYLLKQMEPEELQIAINSVLNGKTYFPQDITSMLVQDLIIKPKHAEQTLNFTNRELQILELMAAEKTVAEIAEKLSVSRRTIESHKVKMMEKLNVKSTIGLIKLAFENDLI